MWRSIIGTLAVASLLILGCGSSANTESSTTSSKTTTTSSTSTNAKKPKTKPKPVNSETQACAGYSGPDANACRDSYEFLCVNGKAKQTVQKYLAGSTPDLSTVAKKWALGYYTQQGSWEAGMAGCLAVLMDEYKRASGG